MPDALIHDKDIANGYQKVSKPKPPILTKVMTDETVDPQPKSPIPDPHVTDAYLQFMHRLTLKYRICEKPEDKSTSEICELIGMIPGNTSQLGLDARRFCYYASIPLSFGLVCLPYCLYYSQAAKFRVADNHFALVEDRSTKKPETKIYGPGYHFLGLYRYVQGQYSLKDTVKNNLIQSSLGDLTIITVDQGTIAMFEYNGQYKILGPGLHVIRDTMIFQQTIRLDKFYIRVGPEKWLTIPDQYDGIAIDNGKTVILGGGRQYHLPHENYKFVKLVPKIILTDRIVTDVPKYVKNVNRNGDLPTVSGGMDTAYYLQTKTKDGSVLYLDTMLFWRITDTGKAARRAMTVMELRNEADASEDETVHVTSASRNIDNLRKTVLRYAKSCLSEAVGQCCLTEDDKFLTSNVSSTEKQLEQQVDAEVSDSLVTLNFAIQNFLNNAAKDLTVSLNRELEEYGVHVSKITINDAIPSEEVQMQLDAQTKARIDRNTELVLAETRRQVAEENVRTDRIERSGEASNRLEAAKIAKATSIIEAEGVADRERIVAKGKQEAAEMQESTQLGRQLAAISAVGEAAGAFNSGEGNKVYVVGSPIEAMSRAVGGAVPGIMAALSGTG